MRTCTDIVLRLLVFVPLAGGLLVQSGTAQGCAFYPDADATTGPASIHPFGATNPLDLTTANQVLLFKVPRSLLPAQPTRICALGFASAATRVHHFDVLRVRIGQSLSPTLDPNFALNMTGFTALVVDYTDWTWTTPADRWTYIGTYTTYPFDPLNGDLVVQIITAGAASSGAGMPGFRSDPNVPSVLQTAWRFAPGRGVVGTGAPKIRVCWDAADVQTFGRGCQGSNGLIPRLELGGTARLGQTVTIGLRDAALAAPAAVLVMDPRLRVLPIDLGLFGATGCSLDLFLSGLFDPFPLQNGMVTLPVRIPNIRALVCGVLWAQWLPVDLAANILGIVSSTIGRVLIGS